MSANNHNPISIVIDGPAGVGKSTVAKELARRLGYNYVDTGSMYRVATLLALEVGIPLEITNQARIADLVANQPFTFILANTGVTIYHGTRDITDAVRDPSVSRQVSVVSAFSAVRQRLTELQRQLASLGNVVMDGRDLGTVVLPQASHKFFLTASLDTRVHRRFLELRAKGLKINHESLKAEIALRDRLDSNRQHAPLLKADDAIVVDTSNLSVDEVLDLMLRLISPS